MGRSTRTPLATDQRVKYRVPHQRRGTRVSHSKSRLGPDHLGVWLGVVVDHWGDTIQIVYDDLPDDVFILRADEARYMVDRGLMRFTPPPRERRMRLGPDDVPCKFPGCKATGKARKKCPPEHRGPGASKPEYWGNATEESQHIALTPPPSQDKMTLSNQRGEMPLTEEKSNMATAEKLSAKQAAIEIGTDARTLRKFLRSDSSTFEACGQGNRYEFAKGEIKKLKKEFAAWGGGKSPAKSKKEPIAQEPDDDEITDDELDEEVDDEEVADDDEDEDIDLEDLEIEDED